MNKLYLIIYILIVLSACNQLKSSNAPKDFEDIDTLSQTTDSIKRNKSLNDIRFDGWEDSNWLDNEYIRTLRKYLDDYNDGIVSNPALDPYKEHIKDSFKLINLLVLTTFIMGILLYPFYKTDLQVTMIILGIEILSMYMYPIYITKLIYIQMEHSTYKATISKQIANVIRAICSFIPTPYCTSIGFAGAVIFQLVISKYIIFKNNIIMEKKEKIKT